MKLYLGDGVYIETDTTVLGGFILTTEDGIHETNRIVLEDEVWSNLKHYMKETGQ